MNPIILSSSQDSAEGNQFRNFNFSPVEESKQYIATDSKSQLDFFFIFKTNSHFFSRYLQLNKDKEMKPSYCVGVVQYIASSHKLVKTRESSAMYEKSVMTVFEVIELTAYVLHKDNPPAWE